MTDNTMENEQRRQEFQISESTVSDPSKKDTLMTRIDTTEESSRSSDSLKKSNLSTEDLSRDSMKIPVAIEIQQDSQQTMDNTSKCSVVSEDISVNECKQQETVSDDHGEDMVTPAHGEGIMTVHEGMTSEYSEGMLTALYNEGTLTTVYTASGPTVKVSPELQCSEDSDDHDSYSDLDTPSPDFYDSMVSFSNDFPSHPDESSQSPSMHTCSLGSENDDLEPLIKISQVFSQADSIHCAEDPMSSLISDINQDVEDNFNFDMKAESSLSELQTPDSVCTSSQSSSIVSVKTELPVIIDLDRYEDGSSQCFLQDMSEDHSKYPTESPLSSKSDAPQLVPQSSHAMLQSLPSTSGVFKCSTAPSCYETFIHSDIDHKMIRPENIKVENNSHQNMFEGLDTSINLMNPLYDSHFGFSGPMSSSSLTFAPNHSDILKSNMVLDANDENCHSTGSDWSGYYPLFPESDIFPQNSGKSVFIEKAVPPHLNQCANKILKVPTPISSYAVRHGISSSFCPEPTRPFLPPYGHSTVPSPYGKQVLSQEIDSPMCFQNDKLGVDGYQWTRPHASGMEYDIPDLGSSLSNHGYRTNPTILSLGNVPYETTDTGYNICTDTLIDDEETDDADEVDDVPVSFCPEPDTASSSCYPKLSPSYCYSEDGSLLIDYSPSLTPSSSSASSTPAPSNTQEPFTPDAPVFGQWSAGDSGYISPRPRQTSAMEPTVLGFDSTTTPYRPYPSMADAMCSARASRNASSKKKGSDRHGSTPYGKPRKNQIQSDKISTSTGKSTSKGRKKMDKASEKTEDQVLDGAEEKEDDLVKTEDCSKSGRHNEPLNQHAVNIMLEWFHLNLDNPYPSKADKEAMAKMGGITENQVKSWFANKRNRTNNTKPKVQKRAMEEKLKSLCMDLKHNPQNSMVDNNHIIQQLSGIIRHCNLPRHKQL